MTPMIHTLVASAVLATAGLAATTPAVAAGWNTLSGAAPIVIAHRGASGYRPEHTLEAYRLAIAQGANYIEPDLVMTKDGVLVARHENVITAINPVTQAVIESTTNVHELAQFAARKTTKSIDGVQVTGWFIEDFTLAELKTLRTRERLPGLRTANTAYNDQFEIPTLQEVIDLAKSESTRLGRTVGIYPELKHSTYMAGVFGANTFENTLVSVLHANYGNSANAPVYIQSFEVANLRYLNTVTDIRLAQLLSGGGRPYDFTVGGDSRTYAQLAQLTDTGLRFIGSYADGVGANTSLMIPLVGGRLGTPTTLVADAHSLGLEVHGWTFRAENAFLPNEFDSRANPAAIGNMQGQVRAFVALGMDGFFTDHPDLGVSAVPEPGTWALLLGGLGLVGAAARRRAR